MCAYVCVYMCVYMCVCVFVYVCSWDEGLFGMVHVDLRDTKCTHTYQASFQS